MSKKTFSFFDQSLLPYSIFNPLLPLITHIDITDSFSTSNFLFEAHKLKVLKEINERSIFWHIERQSLLPSYLKLEERIITFCGSKIIIYNDPSLKDNEVLIMNNPVKNNSFKLDF